MYTWDKGVLLAITIEAIVHIFLNIMGTNLRGVLVKFLKIMKLFFYSLTIIDLWKTENNTPKNLEAGWVERKFITVPLR